MTKNNILFFIEGLNLGGQQTFYYNILKALPKDDYNINVAYVREDADLYNKFAEFSKRIVKIGDGRPTFSWTISDAVRILKVTYQLVQEIRGNKIKILITNSFFSYFIGSIAVFLTGIKHVRCIGGNLSLNEKPHFDGYFNKLRLYKWTHKFFGYRFMYEEHVKRGVAPNKMAWDFHGNAVDFNLFTPKDESFNQSLRQKLTIKTDKIIIGWIGRLYDDLQFYETLDVAKELRSRGFDNFCVLMVGDGPSRKKVEDFAEKHLAPDQIRITGLVPYTEVCDFASLMDVVLLLEEDPHGGSIIREAMACGRVAITVDGKSGSQADIIEHMRDGILVNPETRIQESADFIKLLYSNKNIGKQIGREARLKVLAKLNFDYLTRVFDKELKLLK